VAKHQTLLLICDERLDLAVTDSCPLFFDHNSHLFKNIRGQDFNGFSDFLRNDSGPILGVSFSVFPACRIPDGFTPLILLRPTR